MFLPAYSLNMSSYDNYLVLSLLIEKTIKFSLIIVGQNVSFITDSLENIFWLHNVLLVVSYICLELSNLG